MTTETMEALFVLGGMVIIFAVIVWLIGKAFAEVQSRLGRELTILEIIAVSICFPYSLLLIFFLPPPPSSPERR